MNTIIKEFEHMFTTITPQYISDSGIYDEEIKLLYIKQLPEMVEFLKKNNLTTVRLAVDGNKKAILKDCVMKVYRNHKNELDPFEVKEVSNILNRISDRYNIEDGRVYVIVKQLIDIILTSMRINRQSINMPTLLERMNDETGERTYYNHPALKLKLDHNLAVVKLIVDLNKIIEGEKVNINANFNYDVIPASELYTIPKNIKKINTVDNDISMFIGDNND